MILNPIPKTQNFKSVFHRKVVSLDTKYIIIISQQSKSMLFKSQLNHRDRNGSLWPFRLDSWDISGRDNKRLVRTCCRHSMRSEEDERLEPTVNDTRSCGLRRYQRESVHSRCWMKRGYCPPFVGIRLDASATSNREWHV